MVEGSTPITACPVSVICSYTGHLDCDSKNSCDFRVAHEKWMKKLRG